MLMTVVLSDNGPILLREKKEIEPPPLEEM